MKTHNDQTSDSLPSPDSCDGIGSREGSESGVFPSLIIHTGDCREILLTIPDDSIQCCVTSPPYWGLRDYGIQSQMGLETHPDDFIAGMVAVFREVRRILKPDGTCWINIGDSYSAGGMGKGSGKQTTVRGTQVGGHMDKARKAPTGMKPKDLVGIPWMLAFALRADGWYLRQEIIWSKPNPMPESVTDRCTKAHESIFLLTKSPNYYFDAEAIKEPANGWNDSPLNAGKTALHQLGRSQKNRPSKPKGSFQGKTEEMSATGQNAFRAVTETRNKRSVWTVPSAPFKEAHFATYPPDLIKPCILAGSRPGDTILDPFFGSGTTGAVALELGRRAVGIELNPSYVAISRRRTNITPGLAL